MICGDVWEDAAKRWCRGRAIHAEALPDAAGVYLTGGRLRVVFFNNSLSQEMRIVGTTTTPKRTSSLNN